MSAYPHQRRSSRQSSTEGVSQEKLKEAQLTSMQMRANHPVHLRESSSHGPPERRRNSAIPMCGFALASNFLHRNCGGLVWVYKEKERRRERERERERERRGIDVAGWFRCAAYMQPRMNRGCRLIKLNLKWGSNASRFSLERRRLYVVKEDASIEKKKRGDLALDINLNILYADLQCSEYNWKMWFFHVTTQDSVSLGFLGFKLYYIVTIEC